MKKVNCLKLIFSIYINTTNNINEFLNMPPTAAYILNEKKYKKTIWIYLLKS